MSSVPIIADEIRKIMLFYKKNLALGGEKTPGALDA
jgi:hypothetical protein